jgi:hypothetical protein
VSGLFVASIVGVFALGWWFGSRPSRVPPQAPPAPAPMVEPGHPVMSAAVANAPTLFAEGRALARLRRDAEVEQILKDADAT